MSGYEGDAIGLFLVLLLTAPAACWERSLDSDNFRTREQATRSLYASGSLHDIRALMKSSKPEVRNRARFVYGRRKADLLNGMEPFPFIDSMWWSTKDHTYRFDCPWNTVLEKYLSEPGWGGTGPFAGYRNASACWASDMLDAGVPPWAIRLLFWELHRRDADFLSRFGYPVP